MLHCSYIIYGRAQVSYSTDQMSISQIQIVYNVEEEAHGEQTFSSQCLLYLFCFCGPYISQFLAFKLVSKQTWQIENNPV